MAGGPIWPWQMPPDAGFASDEAEGEPAVDAEPKMPGYGPAKPAVAEIRQLGESTTRPLGAAIVPAEAVADAGIARDGIAQDGIAQNGAIPPLFLLPPIDPQGQLDTMRPQIALQDEADESGPAFDESSRRSVERDLRLLDDLDLDLDDPSDEKSRDADDEEPGRMDLDDLDAEDADEDGDEADDEDDDSLEAGDDKESRDTQPKSIRAISPFADYDPDAESGEGCRYLCPRPDGCPELTEDDAEAYQCPAEIPLPREGAIGRAWGAKRYHWVASDVHYNPLYFEDPQLERYGQTLPAYVQPFASTGRLLGQTLLSPYLMAIDPPHSFVTPLGYYRPGECAPKLHPAFPLDGEAALKASLFYTGAVLVFP